jgi:hypothetical protein
MWRDYQHVQFQSKVEAHYELLLRQNIEQTKQILASMGAQEYDAFYRAEVEKDHRVAEDAFEMHHASNSPIDSEPPQGSVLHEEIERELDSPWAEDED